MDNIDNRTTPLKRFLVHRLEHNDRKITSIGFPKKMWTTSTMKIAGGTRLELALDEMTLLMTQRYDSFT